MINLSTPEAIQAHKDYAQRTCSVCGVDISSKRSNIKTCSNKCSKKAYKLTKAGKASQRASVIKLQNSYEGKLNKAISNKKWYYSDKGKATREVYVKSDGYAKSQWSINQKNSKTSLRVTSMFTKATERQRHRLADWLLRVNHKVCNYYVVDDWIADYNTSGLS